MRARPGSRPSRTAWLAVARAPGLVKLAGLLALTAAFAIAVNWIYQVARKPSELLFPVSGMQYKSPRETWRRYGSLFEEYSTAVITPDFLAALAQVEASGNPVVRTYWRWSWSLHPFSVYRPASSAVGMYQMTDGTFAEARHYCIRNHAVVVDGAWSTRQTCWFNGLYSRLLPADAVELTAADLDRGVSLILERHHMAAASLPHEQSLAAVIHLCGAGAGDAFARHGFQVTDRQRCGDHDVREYLSRVTAMRLTFDRLAMDAPGGST